MTENAATPIPDINVLPAPRLKWLVGVLYYGGIDREHDKCVKALHGHPLVHDVLELTGCPYIDMGRSIIATAVLDNPELGGLLFIDHDMVFDPKEAIACIESAIEAGETVGAPYSMRKPGHIIGGIDGSKIPEGKKLAFFTGGERLPANYLGMGMTAIPRGVLVKLVDYSNREHARKQKLVTELRALLADVTGAISPYGEPLDASRGAALLDELVPFLRDPDLPRLWTGISEAPCVPFFSHVQRQGYYYGEDVSFCLRNHLSGIGIHLDTRLRVYHKGSYCYGIEDVGMEVPYCETLEVVDSKNPKAAPALFSKDAGVRSAIAQASPEHSLPANYPASFDPTEPPDAEASA